LLTAIANGVASSALVVVMTTVFDEPPFTGASWNGGPVTGAGMPEVALALGAPLAVVPPLAVAAPLDAGAMLAAGEALATVPVPPLAPALAPAAPLAPALAPGEPDAPAPAVRSAQAPCWSTAGIGSWNPIATMPIVTAVVPSGRSDRTAPPKTLLPFAAWNEVASRPAAAEALGEAAADGDADDVAEPAGAALLPVEPLLHAAKAAAVTAAATIGAPRRRVEKRPEEARRSALATRTPMSARAGKPS
jgi:hypothetical protein